MEQRLIVQTQQHCVAWKGIAQLVSTPRESDLQKLETILVTIIIVLPVSFAQQQAQGERGVVYNLSLHS